MVICIIAESEQIYKITGTQALPSRELPEHSILIGLLSPVPEGRVRVTYMVLAPILYTVNTLPINENRKISFVIPPYSVLASMMYEYSRPLYSR